MRRALFGLVTVTVVVLLPAPAQAQDCSQERQSCYNNAEQAYNTCADCRDANGNPCNQLIDCANARIASLGWCDNIVYANCLCNTECYGCPGPGGCPAGYTNECVGDQQPDPSRCNCCVNYSPIVVDLRGGTNQIRLSSADDGVCFDINGSGVRLKVAWPVLPTDDAFLVLDRNGNGIVDSGSELFGNTTPLRSGGVANHGYQALAELDANRDGWVDAKDPAFPRLRLWLDTNRNGASEPGELSSLAAHGVVAVSTDARESSRRDAFGNRFRFRAKVRFHRSPLDRFSYDVFPVTTTCPDLSSVFGSSSAILSAMGRKCELRTPPLVRISR